MAYKYVVNHIPKTLNGVKNRKRPANAMNWEYITVHNTGNPKSNAYGERGWLTNKYNLSSSTSYHLVVDENTAIECIPLWENAWHAGDGVEGTGNRKSVGIEVCESGDLQKTIANVQYLIAYMINEKSKRDGKYYTAKQLVRKHQDWSNKYCPRLLIPMWDKFVDGIQTVLNSITETKEKVEIKEEKVEEKEELNSEENWKFDGINKLHEMGLLNSPDAWKNKIDEPMQVWAVTTILARIAEKSIK